MNRNPFGWTDEELAEKVTEAALREHPATGLISYEMDEIYLDAKEAVLNVLAEYRRDERLSR